MMIDILRFNTFIASDVLIFFYYVGAIVMPFLLYRYKNRLIESFSFLKSIDDWLKTLFASLSEKEQQRAVVIMVMVFIMMELFWRMMFEAMIGYFDMHNYLFEMQQSLHSVNSHTE
jgi:hypothetical protein